MNAFGEALNLVFMRGSGDFSSGSMPMDSISDCIPMSSSSYSQANESQTAFPWVQVPISLPMNLWMLEFKSLSPCQWISGCLSLSPYSQPMDSISDCIPMSSSPYSQANGLNLRLHSHEFLSPFQNFGVFWLGTTHVLPSWFRNVHRRSKKSHSGAILGVPMWYV